MEDSKKAQIVEIIIKEINNFEYNWQLARKITDDFIENNNEHYNIDEIMELVIETKNQLTPDYIPPVEVIAPPSDEQILEKLIEEGIVLQEEVDKIVEDLTPTITLAPVEEIIDFPIQDTTVIKQMTGKPIIDIPIITSTEMPLEEPTIPE